MGSLNVKYAAAPQDVFSTCLFGYHDFYPRDPVSDPLLRDSKLHKDALLHSCSMNIYVPNVMIYLLVLWIKDQSSNSRSVFQVCYMLFDV